MVIFTLTLIRCTTEEPDQMDEKKIQEIISSMTPEQKVQLVIGTGMHLDLDIPEPMKKQFEPLMRQFGMIIEPESDDDTAYTSMVGRIRTYLPGSAGVTAEFPGLGITSQVMADGPAGLRIQPLREGDEDTYYATAFPIATLLASSWDTALVRRVGEAMGNEVLEYGADILLAPGLNLQRDPLCGRNFEYYSEDPLVTGKMAAAMVRGIQSNGVGTSIKHYAANNQETNRMALNTVVSARALRELYLKGFEIAVKEAQPWTVMSAYNMINGTYASQDQDLLTAILRDDWGFNGYVVTDWMAGNDVVAQMKAGNDLVMPGTPAGIAELTAALEEERIEESILDRNITRILKIMMKTPRYRNYSFSNDPDLEAHAGVARQVAAEGMVLLENREDALPLSSDVQSVAAFGNSAYEIIIGGTGSGDVNEAYSVSLIEGLKEAGYTPDESLAGEYTEYIEQARAAQGPPANPLAAILGAREPVSEMEVSGDLAARTAASSDVALIMIGRNAGEGGDRQAVEGDFYLTGMEKEMIRNVSEAFRAEGKKTVVVLNIAGVIETASWRDLPDAILCAWQPGQEGGHPIVDVVSGKVNPSGKLAVTFPLSYEDTPTSENFPGEPLASQQEGESPQQEDAGEEAGSPQAIASMFAPTPSEVVYREDIYVGYRYYSTFDVPVAYEFGYGRSYTTFVYTGLELDSPDFDGTLKASVTVTNTGNVAGKEAVQLYVSAPGKTLHKPAMELVAFGKTGLLEPGQSQTLEFGITTGNIASFDEESSSWVAEAGDYELKAGSSSEKILQTVTFTLEEAMTAGKVSRALLPQQEIEPLFAD